MGGRADGGPRVHRWVDALTEQAHALLGGRMVCRMVFGWISEDLQDGRAHAAASRIMGGWMLWLGGRARGASACSGRLAGRIRPAIRGLWLETRPRERETDHGRQHAAACMNVYGFCTFGTFMRQWRYNVAPIEDP